MKLTTKSEYTLLLLLELARKKNEVYVDLQTLCKETEVPHKYAEHLFSVLKKQHIVKGKRGSKGGYLLARPAEKISLAEIIRLMDGALAATDTVSDHFYSLTPIAKEKKVLKVFREIRDYVSNKLENITIADLA
ncbi:MAG: Rrf2 family transcriptional regulator [Leptospirales bacterium]